MADVERLCIQMVLIVAIAHIGITQEPFCSNEKVLPSTSTYGRGFLIPVPECNDTTGNFKFRIYVINPSSNEDLESTVYEATTATSNTVSVTHKAYNYFEFPDVTQRMMVGTTTSEHVFNVTCTRDCGVYVQTSTNMDGFTSLPLTHWGKKYVVVTYCGVLFELCQIVIVAKQATSVTVNLAGENDLTLNLGTTLPNRSPETLTRSLAAYEAWQIQRAYDITGSLVEANYPVGVICGAAKASVGSGPRTGAFLEQMPPFSKYGTEFIVHSTPGRTQIPDAVRIVATERMTTVRGINSRERFLLDEIGSYVTDLFWDYVHIESDRPIVVVKFSLSEQDIVEKGPPSMTYIVPIDQYLYGSLFVAYAGLEAYPQAPGNQGYIILVRPSQTTDCSLSSGTLVKSYNVNSTNYVIEYYELPTTLYVVTVAQCLTASSISAYLSVSAESVSSMEFPLAMGMRSINQPCKVTAQSPGDGVDNNCDGHVDDQACTNGVGADCEADILGQRNIWGTKFTFQTPSHCAPTTEDVILLITKRRADAVPEGQVLVPLAANPLIQQITFTVTQRFMEISVDESTAVGSQIQDKKVVHVSVNDEVSVTLILACPSDSDSRAMATRLLPDNVLGREYYILTHKGSDSNGICQIQVAAVSPDITSIRIRLRVTPDTEVVHFNGTEYYSNDVICVSLGEYESLQIQVSADLTGTHVWSSRPVSVLSGLNRDKFGAGFFLDSFLEMMTPLDAWGSEFVVLLTPHESNDMLCQIGQEYCQDGIKFVAGLPDTTVLLGDNNTVLASQKLEHAGDFGLFFLTTDAAYMVSNKPIFVLQVAKAKAASEMAATKLTPISHYIRYDKIAFYDPGLVGMVPSIIIATADSYVASPNAVDVNGADATTTHFPTINVTEIEVTGFNRDVVMINSTDSGDTFGGYVYVSGNAMTYMFSLAFNLNLTNTACEITKGIRGDGQDNDCDGNIDEEECPESMVQDDDEDGMYNEDCRVLPGFPSPGTSTSMYNATYTNFYAYLYNQTTFNITDIKTEENISTTLTDMFSNNTFENIYNSTNINITFNISEVFNNSNILGSYENSNNDSDSNINLIFFPPADSKYNPQKATNSHSTVTSTTSTKTYMLTTYTSKQISVKTDMDTFTSTSMDSFTHVYPKDMYPYTHHHDTTLSTADVSSSSIESSSSMVTMTETTSHVISASSTGFSYTTSTIETAQSSPTEGTASSFLSSGSLETSTSASIESTSATRAEASTLSTLGESSTASSLSSSVAETTSGALSASSSSPIEPTPTHSSSSSVESTHSSSSFAQSTHSPSSSVESTQTPSSSMESTLTHTSPVDPTPTSSSFVEQTIASSSTADIAETSSTTPALQPSSISSVTTGVEFSLTPSLSSDITPTSVMPSSTLCGCQCPRVTATVMASSELSSVISSIQQELYVDKNDISATRRRKTSAEDDRPSAQTVGYMGVALVAATLIGIFMLDAGTLAREAWKVIKACKNGKIDAT